jgi:hypothetical protein
MLPVVHAEVAAILAVEEIDGGSALDAERPFIPCPIVYDGNAISRLADNPIIATARRAREAHALPDEEFLDWVLAKFLIWLPVGHHIPPM